jgi:prepilin-type N-terminal cleavage/methylation domain-containing protein/prepilin-type processing-associated H-X9-DG protein
MRRRHGFTLIELLVVIAIIGILAAMVFPVFARARESARKSVCLSNVKNIALAIQMYLGDNNDTLPPAEHNADVVHYFSPCADCNEPANKANPYLRWAVILDEYTKNRDVWRCPSAKMVSGASEIIPVQDWFRWWTANADEEGNVENLGNDSSWPAGWGGSVTDSMLQGNAGPDSKAFEQTIGCNSLPNKDLKLASVEETVKFVICGDTGVKSEPESWANMVFPDTCAAEATCVNPDWYVDTNDCYLEGERPLYDWCIIVSLADAKSFWSDGDRRRSYARHLGGTNLGFLDGHAAWWQADAVYSNTNGGQNLQQDTTGDLKGMWCYCRYTETAPE